MPKRTKKDWTVTMTRTVRTAVLVQNCTREEATSNPWDYAVDEMDLEQIDWEVVSVKESI